MNRSVSGVSCGLVLLRALHMFLCPRCREPLEKKTTGGQSVFACPTCGGLAMGWSLVRHQIQPSIANKLWQQARCEQRREGAPCPACRRHMALVPVDVPAGQMFLDVCPTCYIAWFDTKEWETLPHQPPPIPREPELSSAAKEAIALAKLKQLQKREELDTELPDQPWQWIPAALGLPVELDGPMLRCWPWLTWSLVALCCVVYALTFHDIAAFAEQLGFVPKDAFRYGGATLLTSFFLHAGLFHLIGNMYFLLVFGDNVEDYLGRLRYVLMLMLGTALGDLFHAIGDPRSDIPCVGASAGISAVIVFYGLQFPNAQLGLFFRIWYVFRWIRFPAYLGLFGWLLLQVANAYFQTLGITNVSALGHLGGATIGAIFWFVWRYYDSLEQLFGGISSPQDRQ